MMDDNRWLLAILAAALCWGVADVLCDFCIGEDEDEEEFAYELTSLDRPDSDMEASHKATDGHHALASSEHGSQNGGSSNRDFKRAMSKKDDPEMESLVQHQDSPANGRRQISDKVNESLVRRSRISPVGPEDNSGMQHEADPSPATAKELETSHDAASVSSECEEEHLDGVQDCAVAGLTTMTVMYALALKRVHVQTGFGSFHGAGTGGGPDSSSDTLLLRFIWSPSEDSEWWMATFSGTLMFIHYLFLLMAFDSAPSTVINPLIQVSSTWMLLGSAVPAAIMGTTFIRPLDLLCYVIIVVGGILPSLDGNFRKMFTMRFWSQKFVRNTVVSEVSVGVYDLVMSYCLQTSGKKEKFREISPADLEFEFFFIAWCGFVVSFCLTFALLPSFRQRFIDLRKIPRKILILSGIGQALTLLGYYASQFAYSWYYQASIVHAAEASLSQGINLLFALIAFKCFGIGRESAIDNLKIKIVSCVIVTIGLFMLSLSESEEEEVSESTFAKASEILDDLDLDGRLDLGKLPSQFLV